MGVVIDINSTREQKKKRNSILDIVKGRFYGIGIDIHMWGINIILTDIKAEIIDQRFFPNSIDEEKDIAADSKTVVTARIKQGLLEIIEKNGLLPEHIIACGISDAGLIDKKAGISIYYLNIPDWIDVPICNIVGRIIQAPITLFRDSNVMAASEIRIGNLSQLKNLLCISLRHGVAFCSIINGRLYRGETGNAGLWGFSRTFPDIYHPEASIHNDLDLVLGINILKNIYQKIYGSQMDIENMVATIFKAYEEEDPAVAGELVQYMQVLGNQIANLVTIFDIGSIMLTGFFTLCGPKFLQALSECVKEKLPVFKRQQTKIYKGKMGLEAAAWGAACLALDYLFLSQESEPS